MITFPGNWRVATRRVGTSLVLRTKASKTQSRLSSSSTKTDPITTTTTSLHQPPSIELFKYAICPFCNQVKAVLDFVKVDYSTVEVNPLTKAEISWSSDYKKVPIVILKNDENQKQTLKGSDDIVAALLEHPSIIASWPDLVDGLVHTSAAFKDGGAAPTTTLDLQEFRSSPASLQWIRFAKDDLASLLYPNLCPTLSDSYRAFGYVDHVPTFGTFQKLAIKSVGSFAMYMAASRVKRKRNITDAQEALRQALTTLEEDGLGKGSKEFVSGQTLPNLGDVTLFGTIRSLEGLPVHDRVLAHGDGSLQAWYGRMTQFM